MTEAINRLEKLLQLGTNYISKSSEIELTKKPNPHKWSKKEILGHLIDSGINNLQRFTEIQFFDKPYAIRKYSQAELVNANNYQNTDTKEITNLWLALNKQILFLMKNQTTETLDYKVIIDENETSDLRFLMTDYVDHMEHHIKQILAK